MAKLKKINNSNGEFNGVYIFYCPGCEDYHMFDKRWKFNGDFEKPTFTPSLLYKGVVCHLFLTNGVLDFLSDCSHKLAGQKIPLPEIPN